MAARARTMPLTIAAGLEPEQADLLRAIVDAYRADRNQNFYVVKVLDGTWVQHLKFENGRFSTTPGDIVALDEEGYLRAIRRSDGGDISSFVPSRKALEYQAAPGGYIFASGPARSAAYAAVTEARQPFETMLDSASLPADAATLIGEVIDRLEQLEVLIGREHPDTITLDADIKEGHGLVAWLQGASQAIVTFGSGVAGVAKLPEAIAALRKLADLWP